MQTLFFLILLGIIGCGSDNNLDTGPRRPHTPSPGNPLSGPHPPKQNPAMQQLVKHIQQHGLVKPGETAILTVPKKFKKNGCEATHMEVRQTVLKSNNQHYEVYEQKRLIAKKPNKESSSGETCSKYFALKVDAGPVIWVHDHKSEKNELVMRIQNPCQHLRQDLSQNGKQLVTCQVNYVGTRLYLNQSSLEYSANYTYRNGNIMIGRNFTAAYFTENFIWTGSHIRQGIGLDKSNLRQVYFVSLNTLNTENIPRFEFQGQSF